MNLDKLHEIPTDADGIMAAALRTLDALDEQFGQDADERAAILNGEPFIDVTAEQRGRGRGEVWVFVTASVQTSRWVFDADPVAIIKIRRRDGRIRRDELARQVLRRAGFLDKVTVPVKFTAA